MKKPSRISEAFSCVKSTAQKSSYSANLFMLLLKNNMSLHIVPVLREYWHVVVHKPFASVIASRTCLETRTTAFETGGNIVPVHIVFLHQHVLNVRAVLLEQLLIGEVHPAEHLYGVPRGILLSPNQAVADLLLRNVETP